MLFKSSLSQFIKKLPTHFHSFKSIAIVQFILHLSPSTLLIIIFLPRKVVGINIIKIQIQNYVGKRKPQMIRICPLKRRRRKDVKEDPNSVANGRFQCLVALGRFHYLVALERFHCLVALERFQCSVANGRRSRNT
jgi:hypothetical protein